MSVVEDLRQVLQDFLAPELRSVSARFETIESKTDAVNVRVSGVEKTMDARSSALEKTMEARFSAAEERANVRQEMILVHFERIKNLLDVDKRLLRLESQSADVLGKNA